MNFFFAVFCHQEKAVHQVKDAMSSQIFNYWWIFMSHVLLFLNLFFPANIHRLNIDINFCIFDAQVPLLLERSSGLCLYLDSLSMLKMWCAAAAIIPKNIQVIKGSTFSTPERNWQVRRKWSLKSPLRIVVPETSDAQSTPRRTSV